MNNNNKFNSNNKFNNNNLKIRMNFLLIKIITIIDKIH